MACMNPFLEAERARKRESLLQATEADLDKIVAARARARQPLRGKDKIALRADRVLRRRKVARHFRIDIGDDYLSYARDQDSIAAEAKLDGICVLRASAGTSELDSSQIVSSCKALAHVEPAFRAFNTDLDIRPIRHRTETRVRRHVFLRMLSYYITWHMQARLAPLLFTDDDRQAAQAARPSPVAPATRSPRALAKAATKQTPGDLPVHSFSSLLADLATICLNTVRARRPQIRRLRCRPCSPAPRCRLRCTPATRPAAAKTWAMYGVPSGARSATPKDTPTLACPDASASRATAGWSSDISRSGLAPGSTDPVRDISGNTASWQPPDAASAISRRWDARLPAMSPFPQRIAASRQRTPDIVPSPAGCGKAGPSATTTSGRPA